MGSKAFMPKGVPNLPGIFNMRSRLDADSLLPFLKQPEPHAVIVGGGILGLELAASFREMNIKVTCGSAQRAVYGTSTRSRWRANCCTRSY
jgi:ferredoxin-nitrate reductase